MNSAQQQPVRFRVIFLPWTLSSPLCTTLCPQQFVPAPCQRASFTCKTDSFLWGHGPDTLACKARPSFDRCGTSLSVSLSLSLSSLSSIFCSLPLVFSRNKTQQDTTIYETSPFKSRCKHEEAAQTHCHTHPHIVVVEEHITQQH